MSHKMSQQPYRINSSQFQKSVVSFLGDLYKSKMYTDVMLHAEGKVLSAHRIVLAAGSSYFKTLFSTLPNQQNGSMLVVALPNVRYRDLELVVTFMYHGYVDVVNDDLDKFISLAKELKVVGMDETDGENHVDNEEQHQTEEFEVDQENDFIRNSITEEKYHVVDDFFDEDDFDEDQQFENGGDDNDESFGGEVHDSGGRSVVVKPFACGKCGKTYNSNKSLWRHKKFTCDEKIEFKCVCGKVFSRSDNLRRHVVVAHHGV